MLVFLALIVKTLVLLAVLGCLHVAS
jgi:hypothetical protein